LGEAHLQGLEAVIAADGKKRERERERERETETERERGDFILFLYF